VKRVNKNTFSKEDLDAYSYFMKRIHQRVMEIHGLKNLYHTAPTFIARLFTPDETSQHIHDECKLELSSRISNKKRN
jgi:hypothetical protein